MSIDDDIEDATRFAELQAQFEACWKRSGAAKRGSASIR